MSWPSFLQGIIDTFKKGEGDSNDDIQKSKSRGRDCNRNQERGRDPPPRGMNAPDRGNKRFPVTRSGP